MKLYSFKKPISFKNGCVVVNALAYNHKYKKQDQFLVVEGKDELLDKTYKAFYSHKGDFLFIKLYQSQYRKMLVCWKEIYNEDTVEILDKEGNSLVVFSSYLSTNTVSNKLVKKSFSSLINNEKCEKTFMLEKNKWHSVGCFDKLHFAHWCK